MHVGPDARLALIAGGRELPDRIGTFVDGEDRAVDHESAAVGPHRVGLPEHFLKLVAVRIDHRHGLLELHAGEVDDDRIGRPRLAERAAAVRFHLKALCRGVAFGGGLDPLRRCGQ